MKVLVADDDPVWSTLVSTHLQRCGYDTVVVEDGCQAAACLLGPDAPRLALLDWVMPGQDGVDICREVRARKSPVYPYLILLTSKSEREDVVAGLASGADDYLTKPFDQAELIARLQVGERVITLHDEVSSVHRATESLIANAPFGIASIDPGAHMHQANSAFQAMLGMDGAALEGIKLQELMRDPEQYLLLLQYLQNKESFDALEAEFVHREGRIVVLRLSGRTLEQKREAWVELVAEDVTQRYLLEQRCNQAQRVEAIGRFAGSIAHDFNNFLSVIQGCTDLLLRPGTRFRDVRSTDARSKLESIRKAARDAGALIQQLLAFSRRQIMRPESLDLNELVLDFEPMLRHLCGEEILLRSELEAGLGLVQADPSQIRQVLMNLVVNARDAMPLGGRIDIKTCTVHLPSDVRRDTTTVTAGTYVSLLVADRGCGMDTEVQARIFEPFYTTKPEGTGLGLSTTYGIVKQSQGFIWVTSAPQQGASFEIWLPRTQERAQRPVRLQPPPKMDRAATVLLVEDELAVRKVARECLEAFGMTVLEAKDAADAIAIAQERAGDLDLLFTDIVMPDMRGNELADRLRQQYPELKVLFMSGYAYDLAITSAPTSENTGFLQKPFSIATLRARVAELLKSPVGAPGKPGAAGTTAELM